MTSSEERARLELYTVEKQVVPGLGELEAIAARRRIERGGLGKSIGCGATVERSSAD